MQPYGGLNACSFAKHLECVGLRIQERNDNDVGSLAVVGPPNAGHKILGLAFDMRLCASKSRVTNDRRSMFSSLRVHTGPNILRA